MGGIRSLEEEYESLAAPPPPPPLVSQPPPSAAQGSENNGSGKFSSWSQDSYVQGEGASGLAGQQEVTRSPVAPGLTYRAMSVDACFTMASLPGFFLYRPNGACILVRRTPPGHLLGNVIARWLQSSYRT